MIAITTWIPASLADSESSSFLVSPAGVLLFILLGLGLIALLRAFGQVLRRSGLSRATQTRLAVILTVLELAVGAAYVVAALPLLFVGGAARSPFFAIVVVIGALWIGWLVLRDLVPGLVFKAGRPFRPGDSVRIGGVRGRVRRMGYRAVTLVTSGDDEVIIPYRQAACEHVVREPARDGAARHAFTLKPPPGVPLPDVKATAQLAAFNHHWASVAHEASVELGASPAADELEIGVYAIEPLRAPEIEVAVRRAVAALGSAAK